jgi:hypothetical protein
MGAFHVLLGDGKTDAGKRWRNYGVVTVAWRAAPDRPDTRLSTRHQPTAGTTQTKAFAGQSLDPVAFMGAFHVLLGDGKTDAGMPQIMASSLSPGARLLIALIRVYQRAISPLLGPHCPMTKSIGGSSC